VSADTGGPCVSDPDKSLHTGFSTGLSYQYDGAFGRIDLGPYFDNCGDAAVPSATSAWLTISGEQSGNGHQYIQLGIVSCDAWTLTYCYGDAPHFVGSISGCLGFGGTVYPFTWDIGVADYNSHVYRVSQATSNGDWYFFIDNQQRAVVNANDPNIWCWDDGRTRAEFFAERWNRGDSLGDSLGAVFMNDLQYFREDTNQWYVPVGTACVAEPTSGIGRSFCTHFNGTMWAYTLY
jgi:hypothetical protein